MSAEIVARMVAWLAPKVVTPLPGGWTCETYSVDDTWIVQVARTNYAANTLRHQLRTLPKLAVHLGTKIPAPKQACNGPMTTYYKQLVGLPCDQAPDGAWPEQLGQLLGTLHSLNPPVVGLESVEADTLRADLRTDARKLLEIVAPRLAEPDRIKADRLLSEYIDAAKYWRFMPRVIHGDLGPEHVIVSPGGELANSGGSTGERAGGRAGELVGVIDWEEVHTGDPAWDFGWWLHEWPSMGNRVLAAYGGAPDNEFRDRARFAWQLAPWRDVVHGVETQQSDIVESGLDGVRTRL
jgi:aminoglycoside 2''-phosphotransferase